jgi:hypothetical protein
LQQTSEGETLGTDFTNKYQLKKDVQIPTSCMFILGIKVKISAKGTYRYIHSRGEYSNHHPSDPEFGGQMQLNLQKKTSWTKVTLKNI